jgi:hypothetical protein
VFGVMMKVVLILDLEAIVEAKENSLLYMCLRRGCR